MNEFTTQDREKLKKLCDAVCGDEIDPEGHPGLLRMHLEMSREIYGNEKTKSIGLKHKVDTLWDGRLKLIAITAFLGTVGGGVVWLVELFTKK